MMFSVSALPAALAALTFLPPALPGEPHVEAPGGLPEARLAGELTRLSREAGAEAGIHVLHVETGRSASLSADRRFPMASTYKLPIAVAVLEAVYRSRLSLDSRVEIARDDLRPGASESFTKGWKPGLTLSVQKLLDRMLTESDNTATDKLFALLGGPAAVDATLKSLGVTGLDVSRPELLMGADHAGLVLPEGPCDLDCMRALYRAQTSEARARAAARFEADPRDSTEPRAMTALLSRLHRGELLSASSRRLLFDLMRRNRTGDARIRAGVPKGTEVLDKTGTGDRCVNDVGLVTLPDGTHLALAIYVKGRSRQSVAESEKLIARLARAAWDAFAEPVKGR